MTSLTQWTWVWASSGSWWWTGRPGVLRSMGSQRVRHEWAPELNWPDIYACIAGRFVAIWASREAHTVKWFSDVCPESLSCVHQKLTHHHKSRICRYSTFLKSEMKKVFSILVDSDKCERCQVYCYTPSLCTHVCMLSCVWLFCKPMYHTLPDSSVYGFSRREYWSGLPCPPQGDLPHPGLELLFPALPVSHYTWAAIFFLLLSFSFFGQNNWIVLEFTPEKPLFNHPH